MTSFRSVVVDDAMNANTLEQRAWLRRDENIDAFYEELRAMAAHYQALIEIAKSEGRDPRPSSRTYALVSERLCEVRPVALAARRRAAAERGRGEAHDLWHAIEKHRDAHTDENIEPTEHDMELWKVLDRGDDSAEPCAVIT